MADVLAGNLIVKLQAQTGDFNQQMKSAQGSVGSFTKTIEGNKTAIRNASIAFAAVGVAAAGAVIGLVKTSIDFNRGLANVQTMIGKSTARIEELRGGIQKLSIQMGKSTGDITDGAFPHLD